MRTFDRSIRLAFVILALITALLSACASSVGESRPIHATTPRLPTEPAAATIIGVEPARTPGETWLRLADPSEAGWSAEKLAAARAYADSIGSGAVMLVEDGHVVTAWGETNRRFLAHSIRKGFLNALIGIHESSGEIDLDATLAELGIDDIQNLTDAEKRATVADLLRASSGVYHPAAYEADAWKGQQPPRGSQEPGEFWFYNNWDFNALLTIYEQQTGERIFAEFQRRIAGPLGMQDFRTRDGSYFYEPEVSRHPAYLFRISARDLARFGLLYLNEGAWDGEQIVPRGWVSESTRAHIRTSLGNSYGYLWWLPAGELAGYGAYYASGAGSQIMVVLPELDLVFVHLADTYTRNDDLSDQVMTLLHMLLDAQGERHPGPYALEPLETPAFSYPLLDLSPEYLERYTGEYVYTNGASIEVALVDGRLLMDFGFGPFDLLPLTQNEFVVVDSRERVIFTQQPGGLIELDYRAQGTNPMRLVGRDGPAVQSG